MDPDSCETNIKNNKKHKSVHFDIDDSDILQSTWFRRALRPCNEMDRFLLDYGYHFLLPIGIILWAVYFASQI